MSDPKNPNAAALAKLLNLPAPKVDGLVRSGVIPAPADGFFDLAVCANAYIKHLQGLAEDPARQHKADLVREQLRAKRLANDAAEGLSMPVDEVATLLHAALDLVRAALMDQATSLARLHPEIPHAVLISIDAHNRATLEELAATPLPESCRARLDRLDGATPTGDRAHLAN